MFTDKSQHLWRFPLNFFNPANGFARLIFLKTGRNSHPWPPYFILTNSHTQDYKDRFQHGLKQGWNR